MFYRIHICVTHMHTQPGVADRFINDVKKELTEIMKNPGEPIEGKVCFKTFGIHICIYIYD